MMKSFKDFITAKSVRKQYLFLALLLTLVIITYTWLTGVWVGQTGQQRVNEIEKRYEAADLNHQLRRAIIKADNSLDIFLLAPTDESRNAFVGELDEADKIIQSLLESKWAVDSSILPS